MKKTVLFCILLFQLTGNSQTWKKLNSGVNNGLAAVYAPTPSICYVAGMSGIILKTIDGGITWTKQTSGTNSDFYGLFFTSLNTGYAVGNDGAAVRTTNGGATWSPMSPGTSLHLRSVWFYDASLGFISANQGVFKTTDGGNSWTDISPNTSQIFYGVVFTSPTVGYTADFNGNVYKTINGGVSWTSQAIGYFGSGGFLSFTSANNGILSAGNGFVARTTDAGVSWTKVPSGFTDHLAYSHFLDANNGLIAGGHVAADTGVVLRTTDGGASWTPMPTGSTRMYGVYYADATTAYASGTNGSIIKWTNPLPPDSLDARFTSSEPGCSGQLENFYSVSPGTGLTHSWNFGNGANPATSVLAHPSGIVYATAGAKLVTHIVTNGVTSDTVTNIITINPSPVSSFTSVANACMNAPVNFNNTSVNSAGVTYSWDLGTGAIPNISAAQHPKGIIYNSSGKKIITLTVTNQFGCVTTSTDSLFIDPLPVAFAGPDKTICQATSVQLGNIPQSGNTYSWQPSSTLNSAISANPLASPVISTNYTLTVTSTSSGCKNYDSVYVTVNPAPIASFTSNAPVCQGLNVNFMNTGTTGAGTSYTWDFGKDAIPKISTAQNPDGILYHSAGTKNITVTVTNSYKCVTQSIQTIQIHALPEAFAGLDTTICAHTSVILGKAPVTGLLYNWFPSSTLSDKNSSNPVASPIATFTKYNLTVTNPSNGCKNYDTVEVTMLDPLEDFAGADGAICRYGQFQIGKGVIKGQAYSWSPVKGLNNTTLSNPIASPDSTTTYTLTVTGSGCPAITDQVTVTVHQLPVADAGKNDTIAKGASIQLNASGGVQYSWLPVTGLTNPGIYNPHASPLSTTVYIVTVTDIFGCINRDSVRLTVLPSSFWVPTAFTPDGNGISDVFYVRGEGIKNFEFSIFNRWGEQIFISRDINLGWDGKRQNGGEDLPIGAYVYYIKGILSNGEVIQSKGIVNLIR